MQGMLMYHPIHPPPQTQPPAPFHKLGEETQKRKKKKSKKEQDIDRKKNKMEDGLRLNCTDRLHRRRARHPSRPSRAVVHTSGSFLAAERGLAKPNRLPSTFEAGSD